MSHPINIGCPVCGAPAGQRCANKRGLERKAFHRARGTKRRLPHPVLTDPAVVTESPIEQTLAAAILEWLAHTGVHYASVSTQAAIGPFRADILVQDGDDLLVVECDGAKYHSANAEQVARDKRRDRYCAARRICVMRFSGSEINRDPRGCAAEVGLWVLAG